MHLVTDLKALDWKPRSDDVRDGFIAPLTLWGLNFHVEARPVREGPNGTQVAVAPLGVERELDALAEFAAADGPFETAEVHGFECVVTLIPYCE